MAKVKTGPKVKRKATGVPAKAKRVEELARQIEGTSVIFVTEYRGLKVGELQELRRRLRPRGVEYHVVKNSLFARAAEGTGRAGLRSLLAGPTAVAVPGDGGRRMDEAEMAKSLMDETRTFKALRVVGALVSGRAYSAEEVQMLARLPGRPQLQATIVGTLQAPLGTVTGTLQAPFANLIRVLSARGSAAYDQP